MKADDAKALLAFQQKVSRLQRAVMGTLDAANELNDRLGQIKRALDHTPNVEAKWKDTVRSLEKQNRAILRALRGDVVLSARNENTPESIVDRAGPRADIEESRSRCAHRHPTDERRRDRPAGPARHDQIG